jgi:hypothetical protein
MAAPFDRLTEALADRYTLERELGSGGKLKLPPGRTQPRINVVLNWFEELRAKVPP